MEKIKTPPGSFRRGLSSSIAILLVVVILLSACTTSTPTLQPTQPVIPTSAPTPVVIAVDPLYANPWILVAYGDPNNPTVVQGGVDLTLNFSPDGQVNGFGGCNNFSGPVQVATDGTMAIGPLATTLMACAEGMDVETAYLSALQSARSFNFSNEGRLQITYGPDAATSQLMIFIVGTQSLVGPVWVLDSMGDAAAPQAIPAGVVITAIFSEDGNLGGTSGCNQYSVPYTVTDQQLTLGAIAITQMSCPTGMDTEQAYLSALGTAQQVIVSGRKLSIAYNQGAGGLNFVSIAAPLQYSLWTLTAVNGQLVAAGTNVTAMFTPGEAANSGTISGSSGCNTYNAAYTLDGQNIAVQPPAVTRMYCAEGMETEQAYLQALQASTSYAIFYDQLVLTNPSGSLTFNLNRTPLVGALWSLVALGDVTKPQSPVAGSNFNAQFIRIPGSPSGVLNGTTGCNEYTAAFTASADQIKINPPASTQNKSCVPGLSDQEQLYYLALNNATTYHISGNTLTIPYDDGKQALVFEGTQVGEAQRPPLSSLNGSTWYLWYIDNTPILAGTTIVAQFAINADGNSGTISGSAGCNTYVATFGQQMAVQTTLNATQNCTTPKGIMEQEKSYVADLSRAYGYWQTGTQLVINTGVGVLTYQNTKPGSSFDQTHLLVGPTWYLISYGSTYSSEGTQEPYTLFKSDGTLEGYTGCNAFQGKFTTQIQAITVTNLNATQSACPNSTLQAQQDNMLKILGSAKSYQVAETAMQINSDNGVLNYSLSPLHRQQEVAAPVAAFTAPSEVPVNSIVTFDATSSTSGVPIVFYEWDFGDGTKGTGIIVQHAYNAAVTHNVGLTITDELGRQNTLSKRLVVYDITVPSPTPTQPPQPTATTPPQATPTTAPTTAPTAVPTTAPTATPEPTQPPAPVPPTAAINGPGNGYVGEPVYYDASGSTAGSSPIVSYQWNFGDGTSTGPSPDSNVQTLYNQAGTYQVSVVVTDQNGLSSSATTQITISTRLGTPVVYLLSSLNGKSLLPGTAIVLSFLQGQLAGFDGCNSYSGSYTATLNPDGSYTVAITGLISGGVACPTEIMDQASAYMALLGTATTAQAQGTAFYLIAPNGSLIFYQSGSLSVTPY
jgi:heat shock protein HslJ